MVMTRPPAYHPGNFLMKNMNPTNSDHTKKQFIYGRAVSLKVSAKR